MVRTRKGSRHVQRLSIRWQPGPCQAASECVPRYCTCLLGARRWGTQVPARTGTWQVWGYPLLIRASSDSGRHLDLSASGTSKLEVGPAPVYPIIYYSGRFEWVLHWAPSCIASLSSHCPISQSSLHGRCGGGDVCPSPWRLGEKPVTVSIASQSSALSHQQPEPHCNLSHRRICDAGLVHPTLTVPSFWAPAPASLAPSHLSVGTAGTQAVGRPSTSHTFQIRDSFPPTMFRWCGS